MPRLSVSHAVHSSYLLPHYVLSPLVSCCLDSRNIRRPTEHARFSTAGSCYFCTYYLLPPLSHRDAALSKGRGQQARHLRQGGVRHGALSPRAEWRHDTGRRCQNRLIDPELEYAAITNNDLKSPALVDSDLPALAGAVGGGANKMGTVKESKEGALTQSGPHGDKRFSQTMRPTKRRSPRSLPALSRLARRAE